MTAAPKLQGRAPQLGDDTSDAPTGLLDEVVEMSDYLKSIGNPQALKNQQRLIDEFEKAVRALVGKDDLQRSKKPDREGNYRWFKKKSAWKKLAKHFRIDVLHGSHTVTRTEDGNTIAEVIMVGVAPWGQKVEEIGACTTYEERFKYDKSKGWHDCLATAQTRASNRAISALIAAGEVSAEEAEAIQEERGDDQSDAVFPFGDLKGLPPTDGAVHLEALVYAIGWCSATDEKRDKFGAFIEAAWKAVPEKIAATADDQLMKVHKWASTPKRAESWLTLTKETGDAIHARGLDHEAKPKDATTGTALDGQKDEEAEQLASKLNPQPASADPNAPAAAASSGSPAAAAAPIPSTPTTNAVRRPSDNSPVEQWRAYAKTLLDHPANAQLVPSMAGAIDSMPIHQLKNEIGTLEAIVSGWNTKHKKQEQGRAGMAKRRENEKARAEQKGELTESERGFLDDGLDDMGNPLE